jgi:hypothetical protein
MFRNQCRVNVWMFILGDQHLGLVVLPNRLTGVAHHHLWWMVYQYSLNTCLFINDHTCVSWVMGPISFYLHCQAAPERDFRWTVDRTRRPSQLANAISWLQSSGFICLWGHLNISVYAARRELLWFEWNQEFSTECAPLSAEELKLMLKWKGITYNVSCR